MNYCSLLACCVAIHPLMAIMTQLFLLLDPCEQRVVRRISKILSVNVHGDPIDIENSFLLMSFRKNRLKVNYGRCHYYAGIILS